MRSDYARDEVRLGYNRLNCVVLTRMHITLDLIRLDDYQIIFFGFIRLYEGLYQIRLGLLV